MLAHRLSVGTSQFRSQRSDAVVELLNLWFSQNCPWRLRLKAIDQRGKEVDVLRLHRGQFIVVLGKCEVRYGRRGRRIRGLLLQRSRVLLLLLFHICYRRSNGGLQICILILCLLRRRVVPSCKIIHYRPRRGLRVTSDFFQAHSQSLLQVLVESLIYTSVSGLHGRCAAGLVGIRRRSIDRWARLLDAPAHELGVATIVNSDRGQNAEVRKRGGLGRALLVEAVTTVATVVLSVRERERCPATHTDVRVDPLRGLQKAVSHRHYQEYSAIMLTALLSIMLLATVTFGGNC